MMGSLAEAKKHFRPAVVSVVAPALANELKESAISPPDDYYRLDLPLLVIPRKTSAMVRRARRDLSVSIGTYSREHNRLVKDFIRARRLDHATQFILQRLHEYTQCGTAVIFDARTMQGELAAFTVAEYGATQYAFYMFSCRSREHNIPGASDLLFAHLVEGARAEGKHYVNLGLGVNEGIAFFKTKWGATPFLKHVASVQEFQAPSPWGRLFDRFL
jgi:hypothetical protein